MANAHFAKGKEKVLSAAVNYLTDTIKAALVKNNYAQDLANDEFLGPSLSAHVIGTPQTLTGKSITNGVFDAADVTFLAVAAGDTLEGVVIYKDTGVAETSPLLMYIDTITGFPLATNGGNVVIQWDNGAYKIVSL